MRRLCDGFSPYATEKEEQKKVGEKSGREKLTLSTEKRAFSISTGELV